MQKSKNFKVSSKELSRKLGYGGVEDLPDAFAPPSELWVSPEGFEDEPVSMDCVD